MQDNARGAEDPLLSERESSIYHNKASCAVLYRPSSHLLKKLFLGEGDFEAFISIRVSVSISS